ncbi:hypothetical protein QQ045_011944 [Rhodiola kirilowii]
MKRRMGFPDQWIYLIMACVKSVSYIIRINDAVTEEFQPERGLRQGIPYPLICFCYVQNDDSVIFLRATRTDVDYLKETLWLYEEISGQKINLAKSEICFNKNVSAELKEDISDWLGMRQVSSFSKYLGPPVNFSNNKTEIFKFIVDRMWQKVQGWKEKTLSMAGKETLIKSILKAIPTYAMMCYKLSASLCKRIVGIISRYWWSNKDGDRCIYWGSYKLLTKAKEVGGLGMRDFECFNDAILAKQIWRLLSNQEALVSRLLKAKYFKDGDVLQSQLGHMPSFAGRSIWNAKNKISQWISMEGVPQKPVWKGHDSEQPYANLRGEQASVDKMQAFWRRIWRLKAQPKVKLFAWRIYHNFLPAADNLDRRQCKVGNLVVNGKGSLNPFVEAAAVQEGVQWRQRPENSFTVTSLVGDGNWKPPETEFVKINVDGAWNCETGEAGIGLCCRDSDGVVLFVEAEPIAHLESSFEAEMCSLLRSMEVAEEKRVKRVIFVIDSAEVFNVIQRRSSLVGRAAGWKAKIRHLLGRNHFWFINLILREANSEADKLAKMAKGRGWCWRSHDAIPAGVL